MKKWLRGSGLDLEEVEVEGGIAHANEVKCRFPHTALLIPFFFCSFFHFFFLLYFEQSKWW
jgi:hypothetical protein